jgi:hypothetical protein
MLSRKRRRWFAAASSTLPGVPNVQLFGSIAVRLRANHISITVPIAAVVIVAAVVAVRSDCRGSHRCASIDASADRHPCDRPAGYRTISIAASRISAPGSTVSTAMNGAAPGVGSTSVITSTPVAASTAPTCECVVGHKAGTDQNDC